MELNPNHEVTRAVHDSWHKIAALILFKLGHVFKLDHASIIITPKDIENLIHAKLNIALDARSEHNDKDCFTIRLVDDATAAKLAREAGGRTIDN